MMKFRLYSCDRGNGKRSTRGVKRTLTAVLVLILSFIPHHRLRYTVPENTLEVKVVCFSGTDYEIGLQKARVYPDELKKWQGVSERLFCRENGPALKAAYQRCAASLKERSGCLLDEYQGMADGAGIKFEDAVIAHLGEEFLYKAAGLPIPQEYAARRLQEPACSVFVMTTSDRGPIVGNTGDSSSAPGPSSVYSIEKLSYTGSYRVVRCKGAGINEKGFAIGTANAHYIGATGVGDGPSDGLSLLALRYCADVNEAIEYIRDYRFTDDGEHFAMVDISGDAAAIEKGAGTIFRLRQVGAAGYPPGVVWVTNVPPDSDMRALWDWTHYGGNYVTNSDDRFNNLMNIFSAPGFQFTFASANDIAFNHNAVGGICQHGDTCPGQQYTTRTRMMLPDEARLLLAARLIPGEEEWRPCVLRWIDRDVLETVRVLSPNGSETLTTGSIHTINWKSLGAVGGNIRIEYSANKGSDWTTIATVSNTGACDWLVPAIDSNQCLVRISDTVNSAINDASDKVFTIKQCALPSDLTGDCIINFGDFAIFASAWMSQVGQPNWNSTCDISDPKDNIINRKDLAVFVEDWLVGSIPGDFDGDKKVDFKDYATFASAWMSEVGQPTWNPKCDISTPKNNVIDWLDLFAFIQDWLAGIE